MKHSLKVTLILLGMFFAAQLIGLYVTHIYAAQDNQLPYGLTPPKQVNPFSTVIQFIISLGIAVLLLLGLMKLRAEIVLRIWFFVVVVIALSVTFTAFLHSLPYASIVSLVIALPLVYYKVIKRNMIAHNFTELFVYPGIANMFIPLLSIWSAVLLLILISCYDMYAVWQAGFMQKMAKYQIQKVKIFAGFLLPYLDKKQRTALAKAKTLAAKRKVKVSIALLGGGDIVFPIILAGVVLLSRGLLPALFVTLGATLGLAGLLYKSQHGKFYPAMPFITLGCLLGLMLQFLL